MIELRNAGYHQWTVWCFHKHIGTIHREHKIYRVRWGEHPWNHKFTGLYSAALFIYGKVVLEGSL